MRVIDGHVTLGAGHAFSADPGAFVDQMDEAGVAAALISPVDRELAVANREGNDRVLGLARRHPGRLLAYACANPWFGPSAAAEVKRALDEGAVAVKLHPPLQGFSLLDGLCDPILDVAERQRVPVYVHTGTPPGALPLQLAELALRHPGVTFLMGKLGKTDFWRDAQYALDLAANLLADTAHDFPERAVARVHERLGAGRLVFSSNHPVGRLPLELEKVRAMTIPEADLVAILGGNLAAALGDRGGAFA